MKIEVVKTVKNKETCLVLKLDFSMMETVFLYKLIQNIWRTICKLYPITQVNQSLTKNKTKRVIENKREKVYVRVFELIYGGLTHLSSIVLYLNDLLLYSLINIL